MATSARVPTVATAGKPRLVEATTRRGMVPLCVHVPRADARALRRLRATERLSVGESVRRAIAAWLAQRPRKGARP